MPSSELRERANAFAFDAADPAYVADPYPTYRLLRHKHPAYFLEAHGLWLVTRYADVLGAMTNPAVWSSSRGNVVVDSAVRIGRTLGSLDPPRHDELRSIIMRGVSPNRVRALALECRRYTQECLSGLDLRGGFDAIGEFGRVVLNRTLARLVGLDQKSALEADALVDAAIDTSRDAIGPVGAPEAGARLFNFLMERIAEHGPSADAPPDDFLSVLIAARDRGARLENEEIAANMMTVLLAGSASVVHFFGNLLHALWLHPEQKRAVIADPSLLDAAIEETVRWDTSTQCFARQVMQDVEVAGTRIPGGSRALLFLASANRDERAFEDPDTFDIRRKRVKHLGFGAGPHQCLGTYTARQVCRAILEEALPLLGDFELDPARGERVRFVMFRGFKDLPLRAQAR